jgi:hypothetical protein
MFGEIVTTQARVAAELGMYANEIDRIQTQMKFLAVENFVRHGFRREGARLFIENISGADSLAQVAKTAFRLMVPQTLFQWNRRRKREAAAARLGKIDQFLK